MNNIFTLPDYVAHFVSTFACTDEREDTACIRIEKLKNSRTMIVSALDGHSCMLAKMDSDIMLECELQEPICLKINKSVIKFFAEYAAKSVKNRVFGIKFQQQEDNEVFTAIRNDSVAITMDILPQTTAEFLNPRKFFEKFDRQENEDTVHSDEETFCIPFNAYTAFSLKKYKKDSILPIFKTNKAMTLVLYPESVISENVHFKAIVMQCRTKGRKIDNFDID